jgi:hypothetical protein
MNFRIQKFTLSQKLRLQPPHKTNDVACVALTVRTRADPGIQRAAEEQGMSLSIHIGNIC